jgi:hypothetical protein
MRILAIFAALALIIAAPFALKPADNILADADDTLAIITPHNEQIRYEFSRAFGTHYKQRTGRTVRIDWRMPGGTSEIARYLRSEYYAAFERLWRSSGRDWSLEAAATFDDPKADSDARRAFLASHVGIGIDLFFGGGAFDFQQQADAGRLVDSGVIKSHPDWFTEGFDSSKRIRGNFDEGGRWIEQLWPPSGSATTQTRCEDLESKRFRSRGRI